jgi:hypothetical protein
MAILIFQLNYLTKTSQYSKSITNSQNNVWLISNQNGIFQFMEGWLLHKNLKIQKFDTAKNFSSF